MPEHPYDRVAESFLSADRVVEKSFNAMRAFHHGVWLAFLNRESLHYLTAKGYDLWEGYHSTNYNKSGLWKWELDALEAFFYGRCQSLLVAACGGGREMAAIAEREMRVDGFDCSSDLLRRARELLTQQNRDSTLYYAPPDRVPVLEKVYDGHLIGWAGYSHIRGSATRIGFLSALRQHIQPGGPLLLSFFVRDEANERAYRLTATVAQLLSFWRPASDRAEVGDTLAQGVYLHFFREEELARELADANFRLVEYHGKGFGHAVAIAI